MNKIKKGKNIIMGKLSLDSDFEIYYELSGISTGPKMVLIHGLFLNNDSWIKQLPVFESQFHVLRFDLRGHGRTTKPKDRFTIRNYVEDLHNLLIKIDWLNNLYVVGHSLGGMIAMAYEIQYPGQIKKMVVADSFSYVSPDATTDVLGRVKHNPLKSFALGISKKGLSPFNEETAEYIAKLVTDHMTKEDCIKATAASSGFNISQYLKNIRIPTLLIVGDKDITTPIWASGMLDEWLPESKLLVIPKAAHLTIFDHAEEFNRAVINFWKNEKK
jgi:3-oxoadipate enol-lactonase